MTETSLQRQRKATKYQTCLRILTKSCMSYFASPPSEVEVVMKLLITELKVSLFEKLIIL